MAHRNRRFGRQECQASFFRKTELKGGAPGEITVSHGEMLVACKDGKLLKILELQPEGKKRMSAEAFLLGHKIQSGDSFK